MSIFAITSPGITQAVTASASTAALLPSSGAMVRIVNEGSNIAFVAAGGSTVAATLPAAAASQTSLAVLPGSDVLFQRDINKETHISAICRAGATTTLNIYTGEGV